MDPSGIHATATGGGSGGPAPFLLKTYEMVDDNSTDEIVSWSSTNNSFVVWNPPEFARILLPTYFKHNNFSSFIRQLNTYGFRKIDPEKWEFANEDFAKDQKHLLKNIRRRKPIHSHSHPPTVDSERVVYDEEIDKLSREKAALQAQVSGFEQQRSVGKKQLEELTQRLESMEERQDKLMAFIEKALQDRSFVEYLARKIDSMDISAYNKKRRLPQADLSRPVVENSFVDDHNGSRPEFGSVIHQDFCDKLRLELSPAVSDINLLSQSTESSNEDGESPHRKFSDADPRDVPCLLGAPETVEFSDTCGSYMFNRDPVLARKAPSENSGLHQFTQNLISDDELDGHISCHLTLASSSLQVNRGPYSARLPQQCQEAVMPPESRFNRNEIEPETRVTLDKNLGDKDRAKSSSQEAPNNNQAPIARVNDVFWEQFLTERPGSSDNEEASSIFRAHPCDEHDDKRSSHDMPRNAKSMEHLSL